MNRKMTILVAGGLAISLGGCQAILEPFGLAGNRAKERDQLADAYAAAQGDYFAERLATGRENLNNGNFAAAMEAFRHASLGQSTRAEALNGLGVAYAGVGRLDLARRYFYQAASLDPQDTRFAANIARLHRELAAEDERVLLARQEREAASKVAAIASEDLAYTANAVDVRAELPDIADGPVQIDPRPAERRPQTMAGGAIRVEAPPARINRISAREVAIVTPAPADNAAAQSSARPRVEVAKRAEYPVRIVIGEASAGDE